MFDLALWMLCIGLTLTALGFTWPLVRAAHTRQRINDPLPRQAASDRKQFVKRVPCPPTHLDTLSWCQVRTAWEIAENGDEPDLEALRRDAFFGDAAMPTTPIEAESQLRTN